MRKTRKNKQEKRKEKKIAQKRLYVLNDVFHLRSYLASHWEKKRKNVKDAGGLVS